MNPPPLFTFDINWLGLLYRLDLLYPLSAILVIGFNDIVIIVIQTLYFHIFFLLLIITKGIIYNARAYYINCPKNKIKSFSIDNTSDRPSKIVSSKISELFIVLSDHNIDNKTATGVFIINVIDKNNRLVNEFFVLNCNCVSK